ncbi:related to MGS1 - Maintenance of Genome Stability 1 [Ustilago sp. UG-2017a]|nr:related to MGS1 - Maintenance of Genome Stability 1 [Ustilago sp. UG-2017a]
MRRWEWTVRFCVFSIDFHPSPPTCFNPVILLHKVIRSLEPPSPGNSNLSGSSKRPKPKAGLSDTISSNNGDGNSTSGSSTQPFPSTSSSRIDAAKPFAERMRPQTLSEYVGQSDVVNGPLKMLLAQGRIPSMILWGPPGTGKTTLARLVVKSASSSSSSDPPPHRFVEISATNSGTADVKKIMDQALHRLSLTGQPTVLFIDEIQRFTRAQQDVFLPAVEKGHIVLVGATTENPSFRLQSALISRMRVFVLTKLSVDECCQVLRNALTRIQQEEADPRTSRIVSHIDLDLIRWIANMSDGDARTALSALELALSTTDASLSATSNVTSLKKALKRTAFQYDRTGNMHYDTISALHKSIRGSDPDGELYWLARMYNACQIVSLPECGENLAQCVVYLAEAKKSTRSYRAWNKAKALVEGEYNHPVPLHLRNAPTRLMSEIGGGKEYRYEPRFAHPVLQEFFPEQLRETRFLFPPPPSPQDGEGGERGEGEGKGKGKGKGKGEEKGEWHHESMHSRMEKRAGVGPESCQRMFEVGARWVDLDLLDEWEREKNGGREWPGRTRLMEVLERMQARPSGEGARAEHAPDT